MIWTNFRVATIILWTILASFVFGVYMAAVAETYQVGKYDIHNCIYNNAQLNNSPQSSEMIKEIQNECICFSHYNYTNLLEINCSDLDEWITWPNI